MTTKAVRRVRGAGVPQVTVMPEPVENDFSRAVDAAVAERRKQRDTVLGWLRPLMENLREMRAAGHSVSLDLQPSETKDGAMSGQLSCPAFEQGGTGEVRSYDIEINARGDISITIESTGKEHYEDEDDVSCVISTNISKGPGAENVAKFVREGAIRNLALAAMARDDAEGASSFRL